MNQLMSNDPGKSKLNEQIDQNLKRVYDEALNEEVPDRFRQLLDALKKKQAEQ